MKTLFKKGIFFAINIVIAQLDLCINNIRGYLVINHFILKGFITFKKDLTLKLNLQ